MDGKITLPPSLKLRLSRNQVTPISGTWGIDSPLDGDCHGHEDAPREADGGEWVEEESVEVSVDRTPAEAGEHLAAEDGEGVDGDHAEDEEEVVEGKRDQQLVEGVRPQGPGRNKEREKCIVTQGQ